MKALLHLFASADDPFVMRLMCLPVLLCWLLCAVGVTASSSAAWVLWLGTHSPTKEQLLKIIPVAEAVGLPVAAYWIQLADLDAEGEEAYLHAALKSDPRELKALLRLALIVEFRGDRPQAQNLLDQATNYHRSYRSYMAALTQASRWRDATRIERFSRLALEYCPRDADDVYSQLVDLGMAERVFAGASEKWRVDYLRFLIGQTRLKEAMAYQEKLTRSQELDRYRLELCDLLFWKGQKREAAELFAFLHPGFAAEGIFNSQLKSRPSSLGFDWRLSRHEKTKLNWRPGEIEVKVSGHPQPIELMSILIEPRRKLQEKVIPTWGGETDGLYWQMAEAGPNWMRVALIAPPADRDRSFRLTEVRFE